MADATPAPVDGTPVPAPEVTPAVAPEVAPATAPEAAPEAAPDPAPADIVLHVIDGGFGAGVVQH